MGSDERPGRDRPGNLEIARRSFVVTAVAVAMVAIFLLLWKASNIALVIFGAVLFAVFLRGIGNWIADRSSLNRTAALFVTLSLLVGLTAAGSYLFAPRVADQFDELSTTIPRTVDDLSSELKEYEWGKWILDRAPEPSELLSPSAAAQRAGVFFSSLFGGATAIVVIFFSGFFIALNPAVYRDGVIRLVPPAGRERAEEVLVALQSTLSWWLLGRFLSMTAVGVLTWIGLVILDVPLAFSLGLIAGLFSFVPFAGPVLSAIPAILLGLTVSPTKALWVALLYSLVQLVEGNLITPLIDRKTVLIPPALTIIVQVLAGILFGPLGVVLATPLLAALIVITKMLYLEDLLGEDVEVSRAD